MWHTMTLDVLDSFVEPIVSTVVNVPHEMVNGNVKEDGKHNIVL